MTTWCTMQPVQHVGNYDGYGLLRARNPWDVTSEKGVSRVGLAGYEFFFWVWGIGIKQEFSTRINFVPPPPPPPPHNPRFPRGYLAMSRDIFGFHCIWEGRRCYWQLVNRSQGSCQIPYSAQNNQPHKIYQAKNVNSAEVEKLWSGGKGTG